MTLPELPQLDGVEQVADVVALLDTLELDRVRIMAHDWGALVGFLLGLNHPR
jgi:pimeloyl-ACP methyl ester carboxylesterase